MMIIRIFYVIFVIVAAADSSAQTIVSSKHNLSASGPGTIKAKSESEICIFCHTPHNSSPRRPLWNKPDPGVTYTLYGSSTTQASPGQPGGSSLLCLSCHDGTVALGNVLSRTADIEFSGGITTLPPGTTNLSTDLSDDHPISFVYDDALAINDGELEDPDNLTGAVLLENGKMECTACHDPHKNITYDFLTDTNKFSKLCLYCHQKDYWSFSTHKSSGAGWSGAGSDPWFHTPFTTVSENACENCHNAHTASGNERLMNFTPEEQNCLVCHTGTVAGKDIQAQLNKPYNHDVFSYNGVHDPTEAAVAATRHVECSDCHNPHAVNTAGASPPSPSGFIQGVIGVDTNGSAVDPIQNQYELCYRCHADSVDKPGSSISRLIEQSNTRLEFDPGNPSFHPVETQGQNPDVPSLISPLTESSLIYCTDCHASDGASSPAGPHGSIYPHITKYGYETADNTPESYQAYELCYQCHDRNVIISNYNKFEKEIHKKHIQGEKAPCSACHDSHGISGSQGSFLNNSHLINFDISIVSPDPDTGRLEYITNGSFAGECYLKCHGKKHSPEDYKP